MKLDDIIRAIEENSCSAFFYTPSIYKKAVSYIFLKPLEVITIYKKDDLKFSFKQIQKLIDKGYFGYSLINYEAGFLFEERLSALQTNNNDKLIQFFFFEKDEVRRIKSSNIVFEDFNNDYALSNYNLNRTEAQFINDIKKIKNWLKSGETYQVNYTVKGTFNFKGSFSSFFQKLIFNQSARYSTFINNNDKYIISLSPELFLCQNGNRILSQPMKGTSKRGYNLNEDIIAETELLTSEKNLAENVMIVDLIRNDFGKLCKYGSIKVPELFQIEKYESLFQMVTDVKGKLRKKTTTLDILKNIFPCGSVTGAPKIRTMQLINEIEGEDRGIYTGSIGLITPDEIKMSVAIRTISINIKSGKGVMGLGSGIVWDSEPKDEYDEVLLKSKFLTEPMDYFEIFETMKFESGEIKFLEQHIKRMKSSADYFLFKFSENKIDKLLDTLILSLDRQKILKIKILLNKWGILKTEVSNFRAHQKEISVIISQNKIFSKDKFQHFKTTHRKLYNDEYSQYSVKGFFEVLYLNEKDEIAEGSRTNIFYRKENTWFTPSLESGVLAGIYRNYFIQKRNDIIETNVKVDELIKADELLLTNAVQGEVRVNKLYISPSEYISFNN